MDMKSIYVRILCFLILRFGEETSADVSSQDTECRECIQLGGIFERGFRRSEGAFRLAMEHHNRNASSRRFQAHFLVDIISTKDAFKIARLVCNQFSKGVWALVVSVEPDSFDTLHSYANTFHMPLLTPSFPENVPRPSSGLMDYALSLQPDYHRAILDMINYYHWGHIIYLYDSHDGLLRLQELFRSMSSTNATFLLKAIQRVSSSMEALEFLQTIESHDRWSNKFVVLDSDANLAKDLIVRHVQDVRMGRRNYHYLLAGLVMDERWEEGVREFGAINVTGFRIVDISSQYVQSFFTTWRNLNPEDYAGSGKFISAESALMYDSVRLLTEAVGLYRRRNSVVSLMDSFRKTLCDLNGPDQAVFRQGEAIARHLRKLQVEGLTGNISFSKEGRREGFTLDVVEMTVDSDTIKIVEKDYVKLSHMLQIATWSDTYGLQMLQPKSRPPLRVRPVSPNKSYVITTILEKPFIILRQGGNHSGNERYEGYAKELADLLALKMGFNYTLQLVKDNTYGIESEHGDGGWNGIVGELIRKEADIAIAPLTITASREQVIDFTKPFMTFGISIMAKRPLRKSIGVFSFMSPLSEEVWMGVVLACAGVSIVLFLVSRFSPYEWRTTESTTKTTVSNEFTICNSLWFTMGATMQQGIDICPRSFSGRIVGGVWWFFTLILISSYTANLAAFLTVERMVTPVRNADDLSKQTEIEYGMRQGGSTQEFFERSKVSIYARMWEFMSARRHVFTHTYDEGIERVRTSNGKYAFLLESVKNEYMNEQLPCDTFKIGQNINMNGYGVATPKSSPLKDRLTLAILELKEQGVLAALKNKWWFEKSQCRKEKAQDQNTSALTLNNVAGIFYILTGGLVIALLVALVEFCYNAKLDAERSKLSLSETMKAKAKLSISGGKEIDRGRNSSQTLLGHALLRNTSMNDHGLLHNHQNTHHNPHHNHQDYQLKHHHQHHRKNDDQPTFAASSLILQGPLNQGPNYSALKNSHSQISFGSNPPAIPEGNLTLLSAHTNRPQTSTTPGSILKTPSTTQSPSSQNLGNFPF